MIRSLKLVLASAIAALVTFASPHNAMAQYGPYRAAPQYTPYQRVPYQTPGYGPYQQRPNMQPGPTMQDIGGTWLMDGDENQPCQVIPSRGGDRAMFVNENGDRAEGFLRGDQIIVPRWNNLQGRFLGDQIRWGNRSVWTR